MARITLIIYTFLMYSFVCGFTLLFTYKADKSNNSLYFKSYSVLAILVPSIFAGLRGLNVGTDIMVYAYQTFEKAGAYSHIAEFLDKASIEIGYAFIAYVCKHLFGSIQAFLGVTAMLQVIPIYLCAVKLRKKFDMIWPIMVYMMVFYVVGFNVMRQSIAACWILLAYVYLEEKNYIKMVLACIIAILFHSTGIFGALFLGLAIILDKIKNKKILLFICACFFLTFVFLMQYWSTILIFMGKYGFLGQDKIIGYSNMFSGKSASNYFFSMDTAQYAETIFKVLLFIPAIMFRRRSKDQYFNTSFGIYLIGTLVYLYFVIIHHTSYGYRLSIYAEFFLIILLPFLLAKDRGKHTTGRIALRRMPIKTLLTFLIVFLNWLIMFVVLQSHGTYPFKFFFE